MKTIKVFLKGGLGNILKAIPLIKVLAKQYEVYIVLQPDLRLATIEQIYQLFQNWSDRDNRIKCLKNKDFNTDLTLYSPYMSFASALNNEIINWKDVSDVGESRLYLNLYSKKQELDFSSTPLYSNKSYNSLTEKYLISNLCKPNWTIKLYKHFNEIKKRLDCIEIYDTKSYTLEDIAAMCKSAKAFIGIDSGLSNLAAAVGCKTFIIFGPTSIRKNIPIGDVIPIYKDMGCRPCQGKSDFSLTSPCSKHELPKCLDIDPDAIVNIIKKNV